jgi:hypothetical protein
MATATGVVRVQPSSVIKPQQPSKISEFSVDLPAHPSFQTGLDSPCKPGLVQRARKRGIKVLLS